MIPFTQPSESDLIYVEQAYRNRDPYFYDTIGRRRIPAPDLSSGDRRCLVQPGRRSGILYRRRYSPLESRGLGFKSTYGLPFRLPIVSAVIFIEA